jgi:shikimate dehydrogenase
MNTTPSKLLIAVAQRPSSNGVYFYNGVFDKLEMPALYLSCPTPSLPGLRETFEFMQLHAASIAAPFKKEVLAYLDELTPVARDTGSVNSIRRDAKKLIGHNADAQGVAALLRQCSLGRGARIIVYGTGGVVPSAVYAARLAFPDCTVQLAGRNDADGRSLAKQLGIAWIGDATDISCDLWMGATPLSVENPTKALNLSAGASTVFDFVPSQTETAFESRVIERGQRLIRGFAFYRAQFLAQFNFFFQQALNPAIFDELARTRLLR